MKFKLRCFLGKVLKIKLIYDYKKGQISSSGLWEINLNQIEKFSYVTERRQYPVNLITDGFTTESEKQKVNVSLTPRLHIDLQWLCECQGYERKGVKNTVHSHRLSTPTARWHWTDTPHGDDVCYRCVCVCVCVWMRLSLLSESGGTRRNVNIQWPR